MSRENSPHILNTSANLLGICFLMLTSLQVLKLKGGTVIDGVLAFAILMFMCSCILSFLSMTRKKIVHKNYELIAEYIFLGGLFSLFVTTMLITFDIIK
jgi:ABC-type multidrug transport system permease subunit